MEDLDPHPDLTTNPTPTRSDAKSRQSSVQCGGNLQADPVPQPLDTGLFTGTAQHQRYRRPSPPMSGIAQLTADELPPDEVPAATAPMNPHLPTMGGTASRAADCTSSNCA